MMDQNPQSEFSNSLVIGLGWQGRNLLRQLKRSLQASVINTDACRTVRLLWLGFEKTGRTSSLPELDSRESTLPELEAGETISIKWDRQRVSQSLNQNAAVMRSLAWLPPGTFDEIVPGRAEGRLAYLWLSLFERDGRLSSILRQLRGTHPLVFIIAGSTDPESAMLADIGRQVRDELANSDFHLFLWAFMEGEKDGYQGWNAAILRELNRIQSATWILSEAVGDSNQKIQESPLFDRVILSESHTLQPAAEIMGVLLDRRMTGKFLEHTASHFPSAGGEMLASTVSTFSAWLPWQEICHLYAAILVDDWGHMTWQKTTQEETSPRIRGADITTFFTERGEFPFTVLGRTDFSQLPDPASGHIELPPNLSQTFQSRLETYLVQRMNKLPDGLLWAANFLTSLEGHLDEVSNALFNCSGRIGYASNLRNEVRGKFKPVVTKSLGEVESWMRALKSTTSDNSLKAQKEAGLTLSSIPNLDWAAPVIPPDLEAVLAGGENAANQVCSDVRRTLAGDYERALRSLGWCWEVGKLWLISPGDHSGDEIRLPVAKAAEAITWLHNQARDLVTRWARQRLEITGLLEDRQAIARGFQTPGSLLNFLPDAEKPLQSTSFLCATNLPRLDDWLKKRNLWDSVDRPVEIGDTFIVRRLKFLHGLQASQINLGVSSREVYQPDFKAGLHIFKAEQNAAIYEKMVFSQDRSMDRPRFKAEFVSLMNDGRAFETAMWCLLFGWLSYLSNGRGWGITAPGDGGAINFSLECQQVAASDSLKGALQNFLILIPGKCMDMVHPLRREMFNATISILNTSIEKQCKIPLAQRQDTLARHREQLNGWRQSMDRFYCEDLFSFQSYLISCFEKNRVKPWSVETPG